MSSRYGRLVMLNPGGPEQEFELAKATISLGRATTNDIVLADVRVSRSHARLECGARGVVLIDHGSSNGTQVNGRDVGRVTLVPGDTISLGSKSLRYQVDAPSEDVGLTVIDSETELDRTMSDEFLPVVINETSHPSLTILTAERTWSIDLNDLDLATIGRDENCEVYIDAEKVSRRHAEVQRSGEAFVLKDLDSMNGTWVQGRSIDQHVLNDGDVIQIGSARIVFKPGFQEQSLTMAEGILEPSSRRTVVFVPGLMGSELWLGNERVWPSVRTLFTNPEIYRYPSEIPLEPRSIVHEVVIVPNLIKLDQYNRLGDYLVDELNYRRDVDFFEFAYDWRQDVRRSAFQLGQLIESLDRQVPVVIIGHSLGTMVSRYYVECLGGDKRVERLILMGGPHKGAVKGLVSILVAPEVVPFGIMGERLRRILMTFPSGYQIVPDYAVGTDQHGQEIDFLQDTSWLDQEYLPLLRLGQEFRQELATTTSIPSVSVFGYGIKTMSSVSVQRDPDGTIKDVRYQSEEKGDSSVLEQSAFMPGSEIHPVHQHHGSLFVDNDVKMRLKLELLRPY
jgi:pSer/pThr/pTyr-binding forkhead associated (FHA) protein